jgi:Protein of unknown function (DUF2892)
MCKRRRALERRTSRSDGIEIFCTPRTDLVNSILFMVSKKRRTRMWYQKNLPTWERAVRLLASIFMASCAWRYGATPVGIAFGVLAVSAILTAFFGYCPACAMAGRTVRKPQDGDK